MIWFLIIWTLATLGFFSLASSMSKHQKQIFAKELTLQQTRLATTVGWLLLIVSLLICSQVYVMKGSQMPTVAMRIRRLRSTASCQPSLFMRKVCCLHSSRLVVFSG